MFLSNTNKGQILQLHNTYAPKKLTPSIQPQFTKD